MERQAYRALPTGGAAVGKAERAPPANAATTRPPLPTLHRYVGHGLGGVNDVAVNAISVIALRLRAP
jgi:hypothetical protein